MIIIFYTYIYERGKEKSKIDKGIECLLLIRK